MDLTLHQKSFKTMKKIIHIVFFLMLALIASGCQEKNKSPKPTPKHQEKKQSQKYTIDTLQKQADAEHMLPVVFKVEPICKNKQQVTVILAVEKTIYQKMKKIDLPYFYTFSAYKEEKGLDFEPVSSNKIRVLTDSEISNSHIDQENPLIADETYVFLQMTQVGKGVFHKEDTLSFAFLSGKHEDVFYFADLKQQVAYFKEAE
ncbi:hypothetical protein HMPREF0556_11760 [Listeria grayi DSM 20601]|uniref:Uncharacterized protein n=2 Tax=Listeria grayi TaxID=1641 RepID=D7V0I2_LISGR|nr:hypothetical protein HMPREF0556_11760 [Listeria grayi DSM 20601]